MEGRPDWWDYPEQCEAGHVWAPGLVIVAWHPCDCAVAVAAPGGNGHQVARCAAKGCSSVWYRPRHDSATVRRCRQPAVSSP